MGKHTTALACFPSQWQEQAIAKKTAAILLESSQSGALATAIQTAKTAPSDVEKLQQKASNALVTASNSGELISMIQDARRQFGGVAQDSTFLDQNIQLARSLLIDAATSGVLG